MVWINFRQTFGGSRLWDKKQPDFGGDLQPAIECVPVANTFHLIIR